MKSNPHKKIGFLLLITINIALLIFALFQSQVFLTAALKVAELQGKFTDFDRKKIKIKNFNPEDVENERSRLKKILADKSFIFEVIRGVKDIAKTINVSPVKISLLPDKAKQFQQLSVASVPFEMKFACSYEQFIEFTRKIENTPYLLTINHLQVTRSKDKLPAIDVIMTVNAYEKLAKDKK